MTETSDWQLIKAYTQENAQAAFGRLVRRHLDLVYCTCLRELGELSLAEDATQAVFLILARKARTFRPGTTLPSWLFTTALLTSKNVRRRELRRQAREQRLVMEMERMPPTSSGWAEMEPLLNEALRSLPDAQRGLVLERFLEDRPLAEIGAARNISEDAARMRLNRALDRLRRWFAARNVILSAAALAALLPQAVHPAPAHCADALLSPAPPPAVPFASDTPAHAIAQGEIHTMNLHRLRLQLGAAALVALLSIGTTSAVRVHTQIKARAVLAEKQQDQAHALAVLERMYAAYAAMHSFRCDVLNQETDNGGQVASYEIERPNRIRFQRATLINDVELSGKALAVCDGSSLYVTCTENKGLADRYAKMSLYHGMGAFSDFGGLPGWGGAPLGGMPGVLFGERIGPITNLSSPEYSLGPPTVRDFSGIRYPVALDVVIARMPYRTGAPGRDWHGAAMTVTYYVGQRDHLLYQVTVADPSSPTSWIVDTETIRGMKVNPKVDPSEFTFTLPVGSREVRDTSDLFPGGRG